MAYIITAILVALFLIVLRSWFVITDVEPHKRVQRGEATAEEVTALTRRVTMYGVITWLIAPAFTYLMLTGIPWHGWWYILMILFLFAFHYVGWSNVLHASFGLMRIFGKSPSAHSPTVTLIVYISLFGAAFVAGLFLGFA